MTADHTTSPFPVPVQRDALEALAVRCEQARLFNEHYAVGFDGSVWSRLRGEWKQLHPCFNSRGYAKLTLILDGRKRDIRLNRMVAHAWHGPPPFPDAVARHLDDDKSNNFASNIAWGSQSDNVLDAMRNGKSDPAANGRAGSHKISGEHSRSAKLNWGTVREIRARSSDGANCSKIARDMGLDRSNVSLIVNNKTWKEAGNADHA